MLHLKYDGGSLTKSTGLANCNHHVIQTGFYDWKGDTAVQKDLKTDLNIVSRVGGQQKPGILSINQAEACEYTNLVARWV
jgi:hypothetical protein